MAMRRIVGRVCIALVIVALVLLLGLALVSLLLGSNREIPSTIYTPGQVNIGLSTDPQAWTGRVVQVRGVVQSGYETGGGVVGHWADELDPSPSTPGPITGEDQLQIAPQAADSSLDLLYHIPYVGDILPRRQRPQYGHAAVYLLKIQNPAMCNPTPAAPRCIAAVVLNAQGWDR